MKFRSFQPLDLCNIFLVKQKSLKSVPLFSLAPYFLTYTVAEENKTSKNYNKNISSYVEILKEVMITLPIKAAKTSSHSFPTLKRLRVTNYFSICPFRKPASH